MLDRSIRKVIDPLLEIPASGLSALKISANSITVTGFILGMLACVAITWEHYTLGLVLILCNRVADGLDGSVARQRGSTDVGGFLDFSLDILFYGGVPFAFALAEPQRLLSASFLIYSFIGTTGSFLAYAVISAKRGVTSDREQKKSFYYSVGLMEGTETIIFFVLFCMLPNQFVPLAWTFGILCWITTAIRIVTGVILFQEPVEEVEKHSASSSSEIASEPQTPVI